MEPYVTVPYVEYVVGSSIGSYLEKVALENGSCDGRFLHFAFHSRTVRYTGTPS